MFLSLLLLRNKEDIGHVAIHWLLIDSVECLSGEEYVGEEDGVDLCEDVEGAAKGLEDHAEEVPRVEADEGYQQ